IADQDNDEGDTIQPISVVATSPMGHALTYTVTGLPYGLSFDPATKMISGTVAYNAADTMPSATVTIAVADSTNPSARVTASFHWTGRDRNAPPVATARPGFVLTTPPGVALANVSIDATDMDSCDHLTMAIRPGDVLPAGVTFTYRDTYPMGTADTC